MDPYVERPDLVATFVIGPQDETILVLRGGKWGPPVGSRKFNVRLGHYEEPWHTAIRTTRRKTGLCIRPDRIQCLGTIWEHDRNLHIFVALLEDVSDLLPYGQHKERTLRYPLVRLPYDLDMELLEGKGICQDYLNFLKTFKSSPDSEMDAMENVRALQRKRLYPVPVGL